MDILLFVIAVIDFLQGRKARSVLIGIFLATNAFDMIKSISFPVSHEMGDLGLILFIFMGIFYKSIYKKHIPIYPLKKVLYFFAFFLIISILIDASVSTTPLSNIILTNRRYWLFIAAYSLAILDRSEIRYILKTIVIINTAILIFTILQYFGIITIFNYDFEKYDNSLFFGFYAPLSLMPSAFILMSPLGKFFFKRFRTLLLILCIIAIFLTVIRSYIISFVIGSILVLYFGQRVSWRTLGLTICMTALVAIVISLVPQITERFSLIDASMEEGSMAFRQGLIDTSINTIKESPRTALFGLGWEYLDFQEAENWTYTQWILATPDTSWAPMFGRLGILGAVIFLSIYGCILKPIFVKASVPPFTPILFGLMIHLLLISFAGSSLIHGRFLLIPYLLYFYILKSDD